MFENVTLIQSTAAGEIFEQLFHIGPGDVLIAITFPRYSKVTMSTVKFARDRGATVIAITDSEASPLAESAQYTLCAKSDMASFVDSLVAPLSLVNALIVAVSREKSVELETSLNGLEQIWEEYEVYDTQGHHG